MVLNFFRQYKPYKQEAASGYEHVTLEFTVSEVTIKCFSMNEFNKTDYLCFT